MKKGTLAEVILPLSVKGTFTYRISGDKAGKISPGSRVAVSFGSKKLYSGIVSGIRGEEENEDANDYKEIGELLDQKPVLNPLQLGLWEWISDYYMCHAGEVMRAALPSGLCLESETIIRPNTEFLDIHKLDYDELRLFNTIENRSGISLKSLPQKINDRGTINILNGLVMKNAVITGQSLKQKYSPKEEPYVVISSKYTDKELNKYLDDLGKAPKQQAILSAYLKLTGYSSGSDLFPVKRSVILKESDALPSSLNTLIKKGILVSLNLETSRLKTLISGISPPATLTGIQSEAMEKTRLLLKEKGVVLLHGVTSSGKTEIYIHLIDEQLRAGRQVLYLLPEISLTSHIIDRLSKHFGNNSAVYHSRLTDAEQVEIWNRVAGTGKQDRINLIIGARSSIFLPFSNMGLIIVDEEHDTSFKQADPSPRYNARDTSIMLGAMTGSHVILGSATPSLESYHNARTGKYGLVELKERYGNVNMPEIILADTRDAARKKRMVSHFSPQLLRCIDDALSKNEQVILFRNRRGFSSYLECSECGWIPSCSNCSVNLTYHKEINRLVCHYCGVSVTIPVKCGNCAQVTLRTVGYGTEKIEDEIKIVFPAARVARIDQDSTRTKTAFRDIIKTFEEGKTDILIGTQMISKGLDFENITVVGILNADSMLNFPDFRSHERAFQLMSQVSGRAGRREKHGRVIIQTSDPENPIIRKVLNNDYTGMYASQMEERKLFNYPPFCRMIKISMKHRDRAKLNEFSAIIGNELRSVFGKRVLGPEYPLISRIQLWYIKNIIIKIERDKPLPKAKKMILEVMERAGKLKGGGGLRINIDVDPY
jgi:primosomal protein N' (replication factor Y)